MKAIGGYFGLEPFEERYDNYFQNAIKLNTGRNALEYILLQRDYSKIYLPYYSCEVLLEPIMRQNIEYEFYHISKDLLPEITNNKPNEAILWINYFGILDNQISLLSNKNINLIIDNSQALYAKPLSRIATFYSPRKFFGFPDGGLVYMKKQKDFSLDKDNSEDRISHLIKRVAINAESGFEDFRINEAKLDNLPLKLMSDFTENALRCVNFESAKHIRNRNFNDLHSKLKSINQITPLIEKSEFEAPMIYPFLSENNSELRDKLIKNKVYVAKYWPNVLNRVKVNSYEYFLTDNLLAIPIDHRITNEDIEYITNLIV